MNAAAAVADADDAADDDFLLIIFLSSQTLLIDKNLLKVKTKNDIVLHVQLYRDISWNLRSHGLPPDTSKLQPDRPVLD